MESGSKSFKKKEEQTFAFIEEHYDENGEKTTYTGMFDSDETPDGYGDLEKIKTE